MRGCLVLALAIVAFTGCEAPSEPAPAAQSDPLEEAIARGHYPAPVAGFLRRLATLPPGLSEGATLEHLGLTDEAPGGYDAEDGVVRFWNLAPGYQVAIFIRDFLLAGPPEVIHVSVTFAGEPDFPGPAWGATKVPLYWFRGRLRYE